MGLDTVAARSYDNWEMSDGEIAAGPTYSQALNGDHVLTSETKPPAADTLVDMAMAYFRGKALCAAVQLGIANALTALGDPLRRSAPDSVWASMVFWADLIADAWTYLPECVRAGGKTGAEASMERDGVRSRWSMEPNAEAIFHAVFAEPTPSAMAPFVAAYDFSASDIVADLGGAGGSLMSAILGAHPEVRGILVDRQEASGRATQRLKDAGLSDRCQFVVGDLLEAVPRGAGIYILKSLLHGYGDEDARRILKNCHEAMMSSARLLVIECVIPATINAGDGDVEKLLMSDLNMLVVTGGRERNEVEWKSLLSSSGFDSMGVIAIPGVGASIIESVKS